MPTEDSAALTDALAEKALQDRLAVVVLANAKFHISTKVKGKRPVSEESGMLSRYLPPYALRLNSITALWKHVKSFLLPRRC